MEEDILFIDKPKCITSFDVIRRLRKKFGIRKMGHAGTLDPLASGLMIIGVNKGTKKLNQFLKLDKVYEVDVLLGVKTDSGDMEGKVIEKKEVGNIEAQSVGEVIKSITGTIELPVPIYSAIKRGGEALYKKARRGEKVEAPLKEMKIFWIKLLSIDKSVIRLEIKVSSGTYIRSIAEEIGKRLGLPATVKELRRTQIDKYKVEQAEVL